MSNITDNHPCKIRCWRVGASSELDKSGACLECGYTMADPEADEPITIEETSVRKGDKADHYGCSDRCQ